MANRPIAKNEKMANSRLKIENYKKSKKIIYRNRLKTRNGIA